MRHTIIIILLFTLSIFPQKQKGKITFNLEGEWFDLPITTINLVKEEKIVIGFQAEKDDFNANQVVEMELGFKKLTMVDSGGLDPYSLRLKIESKTKDSNVCRILKFGFQQKVGDYSISSKDVKSAWEIENVYLKFDVTEISYRNEQLVITGVFSCKFGTTQVWSSAHLGIVEIKDGRFEILI